MQVLDIPVHDSYLIHLQNTNQNKMSKCSNVICMSSSRYNSTMLNWNQHLTTNLGFWNSNCYKVLQFTVHHNISISSLVKKIISCTWSAYTSSYKNSKDFSTGQGPLHKYEDWVCCGSLHATERDWMFPKQWQNTASPNAR